MNDITLQQQIMLTEGRIAVRKLNGSDAALDDDILTSLRRLQAIEQVALDAATSLETISVLSGKKGHYMETVFDVRSYAASRAKVARDAMLAAVEIKP